MKAKTKVLAVLLAATVLILSALSGCTATDPITDNIYIEGSLYVWDGAAWQLVTGGGGAGDVTGPASSTDNMIARHDGATGKILQDYTSNPPTISDTGDMNVDGDVDCDNVVVSGTVDGVDVASHASRHAVSGADTVFPADPDADRYLMWDDVPGNLAWAALAGGGDMTKATYDNDDDGLIDTAAGGTEWDSSGETGFAYITAGTWSAVAKGIADDNVATIDQADAADDEYVRLTANGLESRNEAEFKGDYNLEIGTDVLAQQTIGIADDNLLEVDGSPNDDEYARFTANGLEGRTEAEFKGDFNLEIGTDVLAQQTIGIGDDNLLEVDDAAAADDDMARFTANGIEGISAQTALSFLFAEVLLENDAVKLDPSLSADGKYNGVTVTGTAGTALSFGDLCYLQTSDSRWELAKADSESTSSLKLGICVQAAAGDGNATTMLLWGSVRADTAFPALTVGDPVFISAATAGDVVTTAPSGTTGYVVRVIGYGNTADEMHFCPDNTWIELA